jgi:hypothetical protein
VTRGRLKRGLNFGGGVPRSPGLPWPCSKAMEAPWIWGMYQWRPKVLHKRLSERIARTGCTQASHPRPARVVRHLHKKMWEKRLIKTFKATKEKQAIGVSGLFG